MVELPFLVVHGAVIAKLVVGVPAAAGLGAILLTRRRRDRRAARQIVAAWTAQVTGPTEGEVTLCGVFRETATEAWLEVAGERVVLATPPTVLRGSRARWSWHAATPSHTIADRDEVVVRGQLARQADGTADAAASYRREAGTWVMTAAQAVATRPATRARPLHPLATLSWLAVLGLMAWFGGRALGRTGLDHHREFDRLRTDHVPDGLVRAAAMPGTRSDALRELASFYEREYVNSAEANELRIGIARLRDGCAGEGAALADQDRFEAALAVATACGDDETAFEQLLFLGRYEQAEAIASTANASPYERGLAALGAGHWARAADVVDEVVVELRAAPGYGADADRADGAVGMSCLASLFRVHAGDAAAAAKLRADASAGPTCAVIEALSRPPAEQAAALRAAKAQLPEFHRLRFDVDLLLWAAGDPPTDGVSLFTPIAAQLDAFADYHEPWLATTALALRDSALSRAWMVSYDVLRGDFADARVQAAQVRAQSPTRSTYDNAEALEIGIAVRTGGPLPASIAEVHPAVADAASLRGARGPRTDAVAARFATFEQACVPLVEAAFDPARQSEGGPLAEVLERCTIHWSRAPVLLLARLPSITSERDRVNRAARLLRDSFGSGTLGLPFRFLQRAAIERDLARLTDTPEAAAAWQALIDAHARVLADRDRMIAMILWHKL